MGYIIYSTKIVSLLIANILQIIAITTRFEHEVPSSRNFRRHVGSVPFPDWELGLREAVYQALLRERNLHANLREFLYSAPILGRQDSATPFGDIAVLARGQLYSSPGGFQFVQDPYQNDCDGCHNSPPKCDRFPCENWRPEGHERLLALWSVKRIRHRDANYGYRYELEYKVSPMNIPVDDPFVTRNGRFDYSIPGHTFIVKSDPRQYDNTFQNVNSHPDKVYRSSNSYSSEQWSPNFGPNLDARYLPPPPPPPPAAEEYYDEDPRNVGYPNVLYGPPELYTKRTPYKHYTTKHPTTYDSEDVDIFKDLVPSTTSTTKQVPLRTTSTTHSSFFTPQTTQHIYTLPMTTKTSPQSTTFTTSQLPIQTTYSQFPVLPTIPIQSSFGTTEILHDTPLVTQKGTIPTKPLFTPATIRFPTIPSSLSTNYRSPTTPTTQFSKSTRFVKYSEPDPLFDNNITPTSPTSKTTKYKTLSNDDFGDMLFGVNEATTVSEKSNNVKFPGLVNIKQPPGEKVIKIVAAPTMTTQGAGDYRRILTNTERSQPTRSTPRYHFDFNNTHLLKPNGETYITIPLSPSTRVQQHTSPEATLTTGSVPLSPSTRVQQYTTPEVTLPTRSSNPYDSTITLNSRIQQHTSPEVTLTTGNLDLYDFTTKPRRFTTPQPLAQPTVSIDDNIISATQEYTSLSTKNLPEDAKSTKAMTPTTKTTSQLTYKTIPETKKITVPIPLTTRIISPSTITLSSISATSPLVSDSTTTTLLTKTTSLPTTTTFSPTKTITSMLVTTTSSTTRKPTRRKTTSKQPTETTTNQQTTHVASDTTTFHTTDSMATSISYSDTPTQTTILITPTTNLELTSTKTPTTTHKIPRITTKPKRFPRPRTKPTPSPIYTTVPELKITSAPTKSTLYPSSSASIKTTAPATRSKARKQTTSATKSTTDSFLFGDEGPTSKKNKMRPGNAQSQDENFDFEIFGTPKLKVTSKYDANKSEHKVSINSKEADDIFGGESDKKQPTHDYNYGDDTTQPTSTTSKLKIIFSDFYSPSTATSTEKVATTNNIRDTTESSTETTTINEVIQASEDSKNKTTQSGPLTSQSYSTSVSFEINKNNETTITPDTHEEINELNTVIKTTQPPCNVTGENVKNTKIFDALALSVVNHAKSIDYLHSNDDSNNNHSNTREQKFKRKRTYRVQKVRRRNYT